MPTSHPAALHRREVLYIDDEEFSLLLMEALFEQRPNLRLVTACSEAEALTVAPRLAPQLLLLDLNLAGGSDGRQVLHTLRQRFGWHDIPAIAITGERDFEPQGSGFCEVWIKPILLLHSLTRLDHWLQQAPQPPAPARATA
ncbi:response regulator [Piscinibacter sakaiensis]|uniref:response regulator n=1 Tax=Piscinibacter sakaiensis TaxID=1547922 RepID=UPI003AB0303C